MTGNITDLGDVLISNCTNEAQIQGSGDVGGILGVGEYSPINIAIENCNNSGAINASGRNCGGIVGYLNSAQHIKNCTNSNSVIGDSCVRWNYW